jgi:2-desacetyl-2-hydroxyethyl bacteriochlorophyllide A dehydrogenase
MRAIVCEQPFRLTEVTRPAPARAPGDVLVRIRRVGICGTDVHIFAGLHPYLAYPRIMGHELSGEVAESDPQCAFRPGQRVTINPYLACGSCIACRNGKPNCCVSLKVLGVHMDGGMCEFISVPPGALIDAEGLSLEEAASVEFLAIGAHAVGRAALAPGETVLVVGAGPIGIAAALFARAAGARVTLLEKTPKRIQFARGTLGFDSIVTVGADTAEQLAAQTGGEMFRCVLDATGNIAAMRAGLHYVCHGGRYVLVSVVTDDISFPDPEFHKRETTLLASRNALNSDFARVIAGIRDGSIPARLLHTHSFDVGNIAQSFAQLHHDRDNVVKALVAFG